MVCMDFYVGPASLLMDGESFAATAFIDSDRGEDIEDWGGYLEIGGSGLLTFRALIAGGVFVRVPGSSAREVIIQYAQHDGMVFAGCGRTPLPIPIQGTTDVSGAP
jgi:hypothetical protein